MTLRPSSVQELAAIVLDAHDRSTPLRIVGRGAWLDAGRAVVPHAVRLELDGLTGIVGYVPGDLTLTARAGTTLAELDEATAPHAQWCPLQSWGDDNATVGAVFATATSGPFERALGRPRDLALGLEYVDGTGATIHAGGRVVKNVAGFDLTRLLVGSWGTLGAIAEVTVRLRARPTVDESWAIAADLTDATVHARCTALERGTYAPLALRRILESETDSLGLPKECTLLVRVGGNASFVAASRAALRELGAITPCDTTVWTRYRALFATSLPTVTEPGIGDPISRRIKERFDPRRVLNPGILGEAVT